MSYLQQILVERPFFSREDSPEAPAPPLHRDIIGLDGQARIQPVSGIEVTPPSQIQVGVPLWPPLVISTSCPRMPFSDSSASIYICDGNEQLAERDGVCLMVPPERRDAHNRYPTRPARPNGDMILNRTEGFNTTIVYSVFHSVRFDKPGRYRIRIYVHFRKRSWGFSSMQTLFTSPIDVVSYQVPREYGCKFT